MTKYYRVPAWGNTEHEILQAACKSILPDVCQEHVYRIDVDRSYEVIDSGMYANVRFIFYNGQIGSFKARIEQTGSGHIELALNFDVEEWQANAIMRCNAGHDVYERPLQTAFAFQWQPPKVK